MLAVSVLSWMFFLDPTMDTNQWDVAHFSSPGFLPKNPAVESLYFHNRQTATLILIEKTWNKKTPEHSAKWKIGMFTQSSLSWYLLEGFPSIVAPTGSFRSCRFHQLLAVKISASTNKNLALSPPWWQFTRPPTQFKDGHPYLTNRIPHKNYWKVRGFTNSKTNLSSFK